MSVIKWLALCPAVPPKAKSSTVSPDTAREKVMSNSAKGRDENASCPALRVIAATGLVGGA